MMDTTEKPRVERVTEPSRAWRNWFAVTERCLDCDGEIVDIGDEMYDPTIWPSKEVATQKARDLLAKCEVSRTTTKYIGAFPVEGAP